MTNSRSVDYHRSWHGKLIFSKNTIELISNKYAMSSLSNRNLPTGRDHYNKGFTAWLAGGGVKRAFSHGQTDEYGYEAVADKVSIHDLHATILHLLGLDHLKLTFKFQGRNFRLTDVAGDVIHKLIA